MKLWFISKSVFLWYTDWKLRFSRSLLIDNSLNKKLADIAMLQFRKTLSKATP